jgi:hypothetical protein
MTAEEFLNWQEFAATEPFLSERVDLAGALIASTAANMNRPKNSKPYSVSDFLLVHKAVEEAGKKPEDAEANHLKATIMLLGGKVS